MDWRGICTHDHVGASLIEVARQPARMMVVTGRLDSSSPCATPGLSNAERLLSRRQAKHPDHRRVEKQVHEAPSRVVGPLTRLLSWPRRGASHDCVKSQCTDAQAYLVLELQGEGAEHDSGDEVLATFFGRDDVGKAWELIANEASTLSGPVG